MTGVPISADRDPHRNEIVGQIKVLRLYELGRCFDAYSHQASPRPEDGDKRRSPG